MKKIEIVEEGIVAGHDEKLGAYKKGEKLTVLIICFAKDLGDSRYPDLYTVVVLNGDGYRLSHINRPSMPKDKAALASNGIAVNLRRDIQR